MTFDHHSYEDDDVGDGDFDSWCDVKHANVLGKCNSLLRCEADR